MIRQLLIASGVLTCHAAALWALQAGLLQRADEPIMPPEIVIEWLPQAGAPSPAPKPVSSPARPQPTLPAPTRVTKPARAPAPLPLAVADPAPSPTAPTGAVQAPISTAPQAVAATAAPTATASTAPVAAVTAPVRVELPSSDADYLQNPKPAYPALSKRLGEQGKVVVRVLIGVDGQAQQTELKQSSGFDRLDQAAVSTVKRWRYVPGKRAGVPQAMWFNVPIHFVLE